MQTHGMTRRGAGRWLALGLMSLVFATGGAACSEDKALKVTALDPPQGDAEGGQYITVKGNRFQKDGARSVKVFFGGVRGTVKGFPSDSELTVVAPPGKAGSVVDVEFEFEPGGYLKMEKGFRYVEAAQGPKLGVTKTP